MASSQNQNAVEASLSAREPGLIRAPRSSPENNRVETMFSSNTAPSITSPQPISRFITEIRASHTALATATTS